jgi:hypothetical protein
VTTTALKIESTQYSVRNVGHMHEITRLATVFEDERSVAVLKTTHEDRSNAGTDSRWTGVSRIPGR